MDSLLDTSREIELESKQRHCFRYRLPDSVNEASEHAMGSIDAVFGIVKEFAAFCRGIHHVHSVIAPCPPNMANNFIFLFIFFYGSFIMTLVS